MTYQCFAVITILKEGRWLCWSSGMGSTYRSGIWSTRYNKMIDGEWGILKRLSWLPLKKRVRDRNLAGFKFRCSQPQHRTLYLTGCERSSPFIALSRWLEGWGNIRSATTFQPRKTWLTRLLLNSVFSCYCLISRYVDVGKSDFHMPRRLHHLSPFHFQIEVIHRNNPRCILFDCGAADIYASKSSAHRRAEYFRNCGNICEGESLILLTSA